MFIKLGLLPSHLTWTKAISLQYNGQSYNYILEKWALTHILVFLLLRPEVTTNNKHETAVELNDKQEFITALLKWFASKLLQSCTFTFLLPGPPLRGSQ